MYTWSANPFLGKYLVMLNISSFLSHANGANLQVLGSGAKHHRMANQGYKFSRIPLSPQGEGGKHFLIIKGNNEKIEDWRPITLLSCGYKIISGVVACRLEKYLKKITGRAQKGFLRHKNINTVTLNILNNISKAWEVEEELGVLCVDFNKAFDSIEHACVSSVLKFFNFGENMVGMVSTILRDRTARVLK